MKSHKLKFYLTLDGVLFVQPARLQFVPSVGMRIRLNHLDEFRCIKEVWCDVDVLEIDLEPIAGELPEVVEKYGWTIV